MIPTAPTPARSLLLTVLAALLALPAAARDDDRDPGWYDKAELSLVSTSGNSESTSFAFRNLLERIWESARFSLSLGGLRTENDEGNRFAVGTPGDFEVVKDSSSELTAENYFLRTRYDRDISEQFFWFAGLGWERNEFAGFRDRTTGIVGAGYRWWENDDGHFFTDAGLTWTQQDDIVENPVLDDSFAGLQLGTDLLWVVNDRVEYANVLVVNENLDETDDLRADMQNTLAVSMTDRLALQVGLQLLYDNLPALEEIPLVDADGVPFDTVVAELDELDTVFTAALVFKFP